MGEACTHTRTRTHTRHAHAHAHTHLHKHIRTHTHEQTRRSTASRATTSHASSSTSGPICALELTPAAKLFFFARTGGLPADVGSRIPEFARLDVGAGCALRHGARGRQQRCILREGWGFLLFIYSDFLIPFTQHGWGLLLVS